jgi:RHS repeat-associated protein
VRQKFTGKERDAETTLDYFVARYYASAHGRFNSPDPLLASGKAATPQTWNRYAYVLNNPLGMVDQNGTDATDAEEIARRMREAQQNQPLQTSNDTIAQSVTQRPVYEVRVTDVSIFQGTFPQTGGIAENRGQQAVNPNGTSAKLPFGFDLSVNYTVTQNGQPVEGVQIFEELKLEGRQAVRDENGVFAIERQGGKDQGPIGPPTDQKGNTTDQPLGANSASPIVSATVTQTLYTMVNGQRRDLAVNSASATFDVRVTNNSVRGTVRGRVEFRSPTMVAAILLSPPKGLR